MLRLTFIFPHSFCSSVNKLVRDYFPSIFNVSALVKPYFFITFVNVGHFMIGIDLVLINVTMSDGCLKFTSTWVMTYSLNSMYWTFSLLSIGDINNSKPPRDYVKLLL